MAKNNNIVLVGGSFTTMLLALKLKLDDPSRDITIIERAKELGGLYRTYRYNDSIKGLTITANYNLTHHMLTYENFQKIKSHNT